MRLSKHKQRHHGRANGVTYACPCRLLHDISKVDRTLGFWAARLKAGQHRSFLLLGQGPTSFLLDILAVVTRKADRRNHLSATDQIERRVCYLPLPTCQTLDSLDRAMPWLAASDGLQSDRAELMAVSSSKCQFCLNQALL